MSTGSSRIEDNALINTLNLAFTQCQDQIRRLARQSEIIDSLRGDNERLQQELEQLRGGVDGEIEARYRAQFQEAFKQVAAKQGEIDRLKEKLRRIKVKAQHRGVKGLISSSPAFSPAKAEVVTPANPTFLVASELKSASTPSKSRLAEQNTEEADQHAPSRKRLRSQSLSREPLQEMAANARSVGSGLSRSADSRIQKKVNQDKGIANIPDLAEDGENHGLSRRLSKPNQTNKALPKDVYSRLDDLLETRSPTDSKKLLARYDVSPSKGRYKSPQTGIPVTDSTSGTATTTMATPKLRSTKSPLRASSSEPRPKRPRPPFRGSKKFGPEDEEPFRARPLDKLSLTHFKLNPSANSGLDYAYNEVVRGHARACLPGCTRDCCAGAFRALAKTLPNLNPDVEEQDEKDNANWAATPNGRPPPFSDHDLLLNFLGPGPVSEERIRKLTPTARENLLHDARTKLVADTYGKLHRDVHERGRSPPGFWRTDMPGTQEMKQDRERARLAEREEVSRRYHDALRGPAGGGKWIFADE